MHKISKITKIHSFKNS